MTKREDAHTTKLTTNRFIFCWWPGHHMLLLSRRYAKFFAFDDVTNLPFKACTKTRLPCPPVSHARPVTRVWIKRLLLRNALLVLRPLCWPVPVKPVCQVGASCFCDAHHVRLFYVALLSILGTYSLIGASACIACPAAKQCPSVCTGVLL